jgi:hypothetical protein
VISGDKVRTYRMTGDMEAINSEWIREMVSNIILDAGFYLDNSSGENLLEVLDGNRYKKIDFLFLSAQNIDFMEFQFEEIKDV